MVKRSAAAVAAVIAVIALSSCADDGGDSQEPGTSETGAPNGDY
jgi:hypothetical protein